MNIYAAISPLWSKKWVDRELDITMWTDVYFGKIWQI